MTALPPQHTLRRPTTGDAQAIFDLISACHLATIGKVDHTLEDVADELVEPDFDPALDGWLAHNPDGRLDGWAWACRKGDSDEVDIAVFARPGHPDLARQLRDTVIGRAKQIAEQLGHHTVVIDISRYPQDEPTRTLIEPLGFAPATSFHRMFIDHQGPVEPPPTPPGVTIHTGDLSLRETAYDIQQRGFAEHFGFVPKTYPQWLADREAAGSTDWNQLHVATIDQTPAAMLLGTNAFVPDENCGYVATLATLREHRGHGLGRLLLRHAFAADAARGRAGTFLHVDTNNTTPALGLYESVGMRPVMAIEIWRKTYPIN